MHRTKNYPVHSANSAELEKPALEGIPTLKRLRTEAQAPGLDLACRFFSFSITCQFHIKIWIPIFLLKNPYIGSAFRHGNNCLELLSSWRLFWMNPELSSSSQSSPHYLLDHRRHLNLWPPGPLIQWFSTLSSYQITWEALRNPSAEAAPQTN